MIGDTIGSSHTDTLLLFQQGQFALAKADSDSLQLAVTHATQEAGSGFEGTPIPYSPRTDDAVSVSYTHLTLPTTSRV